jgi:hypothetical protein
MTFSSRYANFALYAGIISFLFLPGTSHMFTQARESTYQYERVAKE